MLNGAAFRPARGGGWTSERPEAARRPISITIQSEVAQLVDFQLVDLIAGEVPDRFTLFKLGDESASLADDPAYEIGKQYLLFVRPREGSDETKIGDGTWIVTAPDGRLDPTSGGSLESPIAESEVAGAISELSTDELASAVEDQVGRLTQPVAPPQGSTETAAGADRR